MPIPISLADNTTASLAIAPWLVNPWTIAIALNSVLLAIARLLPKQLLTPAGYWHAWVLGILIWGCLGWQGYTIVMAYFLLGSAVTRVGAQRKEAAGIAEKRSGMRGPENVWGSAAAGCLCALGVAWLRWQVPEATAIANGLVVAYVASLSTKLSDTCASEIGKAYGRTTVSITTLQTVPAGTEGAISLEGTLAGILGSLAIAVLGWGMQLIAPIDIVWCAIAAFLATAIESWIGAVLQGRWTWMTNEVVNGINTTVGAALAFAIVAATPL